MLDAANCGLNGTHFVLLSTISLLHPESCCVCILGFACFVTRTPTRIHTILAFLKRCCCKAQTQLSSILQQMSYILLAFKRQIASQYLDQSVVQPCAARTSVHARLCYCWFDSYHTLIASGSVGALMLVYNSPESCL
jgi:hypothetical protein